MDPPAVQTKKYCFFSIPEIKVPKSPPPKRFLALPESVCRSRSDFIKTSKHQNIKTSKHQNIKTSKHQNIKTSKHQKVFKVREPRRADCASAHGMRICLPAVFPKRNGADFAENGEYFQIF
ncbi:MAG: hypothetical protein J6J31_15255 [Thermoguttaceae bacterium]|nr:hypothetical protein [Thermoguttaceae bacterium]